MSDNQSHRLQRVQRELFEALAQFLQHEMPIPLPCYATISSVSLTPDMGAARVFFRLVGSEAAAAEAHAIIQGESAKFQRHVARHVPLKFTPVLRFEFGFAPKLDEVDALFEKLRQPKFGD